MTCIVAVAHEGKVTMGADSASVSGWDVTIERFPKIVEVGSFLIGFTSSWRMGQLLAHSMTPPERLEGQTVEAYLITGFIGAVRQALRDGGFAKKENEVEQGGQFLVGFEGRIFQVHSDYQVAENEIGFDACGSGADYAMGAMLSTPHLAPQDRVLKALQAAGTFSIGVRPPFITVTR